MKEFGVNYDILYEIWLMYNSNIASGMNSLQAIENIQKRDVEEWNKGLRFFISYSLNIISYEISKEGIML
jgi:hypothetical protein